MKLIIFLALAMVFIADARLTRHRIQGGEGQEGNTDNCIEKCKAEPLELSFVVDASASIWQENFTRGLSFIEDFVSEFDISQHAVRVSMVTYGDVVYTQDAFGLLAYNNKQALKQAISKIPYHGGSKTNTSGGIWYMLRNQKPEARSGVRHVAIVLTDGNSQEANLTKDSADDARETGLDVVAIGVGLNVSYQELHNIASNDKFVFVVSAYDMLKDIKERLAYQACASRPNPVCKMEPMDLSFVIDSSTSIGRGNFTIGMQFVQDFVDYFQINPTIVRVSAVSFGDRVYKQDSFGFDDNSNEKDVLDKLAKFTWQHGTTTKTGAGIHYMRTVHMVKRRPRAAHVCIVITDGESQDGKVTKQEARKAQADDIIMYAIGIGEYGKQLNEDELNSIAGDPERVLTVTSYSQLNLLKGQLANQTCAGVVAALSRKINTLKTRL